MIIHVLKKMWNQILKEDTIPLDKVTRLSYVTSLQNIFERQVIVDIIGFGLVIASFLNSWTQNM